jgi:hypothetical protein
MWHSHHERPTTDTWVLGFFPEDSRQERAILQLWFTIVEGDPYWYEPTHREARAAPRQWTEMPLDFNRPRPRLP